MSAWMIYLADVCTAICTIAALGFAWCLFIAGVVCLHAAINDLTFHEVAAKAKGVFKLWSVVFIVSLLIVMFVPSGNVIERMAGVDTPVEVQHGADR